ncbi:MAG: hypothetical protein ACFBSE_27380 [Prochloraceae cyanobacterium]
MKIRPSKYTKKVKKIQPTEKLEREKNSNDFPVEEDDIIAKLEATRLKLKNQDIAKIAGEKSPQELRAFALSNLSPDIVYDYALFAREVYGRDESIPPDLSIPAFFNLDRNLKIVIWYDDYSYQPIATRARNLAANLDNQQQNYELFYSDLVKGLAIFYLTDLPDADRECQGEILERLQAATQRKHLRRQLEFILISYNKAIDANPNDAKAYEARGIIWLKLQNSTRAILDFEKAGSIYKQAQQISEFERIIKLLSQIKQPSI